MIRAKRGLMLLAMLPGLSVLGLSVVAAYVSRVLRALGDAMLPAWAHKTQTSLKEAWQRMTPEQRELLIARMRATAPRVEKVRAGQ